MSLPIPITSYNEIHINFDLGNILDSYSRYALENELNTAKIDNIFFNEKTILIIENIIYDKSKQTRENSFGNSDHQCIGDYYVLTEHKFYRTDGISEVKLLSKVNKKLIKDISKFIEKNCISNGFELYHAISELSNMRGKK